MKKCAKCDSEDTREIMLTFGLTETSILEPPQWIGNLCDSCRNEIQEKLDKLLPSYR